MIYMKLESGIVKFNQTFSLKSPLEYDIIRELNIWRDTLYRSRLIGQDESRYGGYGYGNISQKLSSCYFLKNKNKFVITGTQTGGLPELTESHYTTVLEYYPKKNLVIVEGPVKASSESMTHGSIYDLDDEINFVFHAHSPEIWKSSKKLDIPITNENIEYGTPEMAEEVNRLFKETNVKDKKIFSMGGHEDGVITFGSNSYEAGGAMLYYLSKVSG